MQSNAPEPGPLFMTLPPEIRDEVYKHVALYAGAYLPSQSGGKITSRTALLQVSPQIRNEYESILYTATPLIETHVQDFDFAHLVKFLDKISDPSVERLPDERTPRRLHINLYLTSKARSNLENLREWLVRFSESSAANLSTTYCVAGTTAPTSLADASNTCNPHLTAANISPVLVMRIVDIVYVDWFVKTKSGRLRAEMGKICNLLRSLEDEIVRVRARLGQPSKPGLFVG